MYLGWIGCKALQSASVNGQDTYHECWTSPIAMKELQSPDQSRMSNAHKEIHVGTDSVRIYLTKSHTMTLNEFNYKLNVSPPLG